MRGLHTAARHRRSTCLAPFDHEHFLGLCRAAKNVLREVACVGEASDDKDHRTRRKRIEVGKRIKRSQSIQALREHQVRRGRVEAAFRLVIVACIPHDLRLFIRKVGRACVCRVRSDTTGCCRASNAVKSYQSPLSTIHCEPTACLPPDVAFQLVRDRW